MSDLKKVTIRKRLGGILIDYTLFTTIAIMMFRLGDWPRLGELEYEHTGINAGINYFILLGIVFYFLKDSVDGRSIGKFIAGIQIVDSRTGHPPVHFDVFFAT